MEYIQCEQGSDEWFMARLGIPTASEYDTVMAVGRGGGPSLTRTKYMRQLAGEIITQQPMEHYTNSAMERGRAMEGEARAAYEILMDVQALPVGFVRAGYTGCSPDFLVGETGVGEIKTKAPHILIDVLLSGEVSPEHKAQIQGELWVCEREWCDFVAYWPGMPIFVKRVFRDEEYIAKIADAVHLFDGELQMLVKKIRGMF